MTLQPGAVFAGYRIERLLGTGGMGEVYLANHPHLPRQDALKVLASHLCNHDAYRQRFLVEANLACRLRHPNIVGIHDRGEYEDRLWIAMDYIDGRNLEDGLKQDGPFPYARALTVMTGIASAVQDLHDSHLLHRDIKPANILVTSRRGEEKAYLTDFGIARDAADSLGLTGTTQAVLTIAYAAPERLSLASSELDYRVDVFSLGCVFYEMLTGRRAFPGDDTRQILHRLMNEYPPPASRLVPGLSDEVDQAIYRAIAKNRDERFASCRDFLQAIQTAGWAPPPTPRPEPPLTVWYRGEDMAPMELRSENLTPYDQERLQRSLGDSAFFRLDPVLPSTSWQGARRELAVQASNGTKTVSWQGPPPLAVQSVCRTIEELSAQSPPKPSRKKRWLIGGGIAVALAAGAAVAIILLTQSSKPPIPAVPANVTAASQPGGIKLSWLPSQNADHYAIYRDNSLLRSSVQGSTFIDSLGNDMTKHSYVVVAISDKDKQSARSNVASASAALRGLNSQETALVGRLPVGLTISGSCAPNLNVENSTIDAAVSCDPADASAAASPTQKVLAYHNVSRTAYQADVRNNEAGLPTTTFDCQAGTPSAGTWHHDSKTVGAFYCFITNNASAFPALAWTTDANLDTLVIYNRPGTGKTGLVGLFKYWDAVPNHVTT